MGDKSLAGRALLLLPLAALGAWSGNATLTRMRHADAQALRSEFIVGSMDDTIADSLETGDLIGFNRKLTALQPPAALYTWLLRVRLNPRFDHVGFIYVDRLGRKFVVEETLARVQCRPYSARILASEATEIVVVPLRKASPRDKQFNANALQFVTQNVGRPSRMSLRQTLAALIDPASYLPADADSTPPLFPSAAFVAEAYEALGLVDPHKLTRDPRVNKATLTPRQLMSKANGLVVKPEAQAQLTSPLPIRLY